MTTHYPTASLWAALDHCDDRARFATLIALSDACRERGQDDWADALAWAAREGKWATLNWYGVSFGGSAYITPQLSNYETEMWYRRHHRRIKEPGDRFGPRYHFGALCCCWAKCVRDGADPTG